MKVKPAVKIISKTRDCFGVWEVSVLINGRAYTYPVDSEYIVRKIEKMLRFRKPGKALHLLSQFKTEGFNYFKEIL